MKTTLLAISAVVLTLGTASPAALAKGPCKQVVQACRSAGFVKGAWKKGNGLWRDCVNPIMQGNTSPTGATKPLPSVDASIVSACHAKRAKFGHGKVGS